MKRTFIRNITLLVFIFPVLLACTEDRKISEPLKNRGEIASHMASMSIQHIAEPTTAPDFELISLTGNKVSLREHRGKVVLVSFWATW